ncbi:hypothetical protein NIB75_05125 [Bacteroides uniformis]|nr:hypothetical protein [Bacteroides uniformis]
MAIAGTPDGKQKYDPEMAAAYLRLVAYTEAPDKNAPDYLPKASTCHELEMKKLLEAQGFRPEPDPQGNLAFGLRLCIRTASQQLGCRSTRTFPLPLGCRALSPRQLLWPLSGTWQHADSYRKTR